MTALACFDAPSVVAAALRKDFGAEITPQSVEAYDPTKRAGRYLAKKWKAIFEETRAAFLENTTAIGISHKAVRLRTLHRMAERAEGQGNLALAAQLLEQAAKEVGGAFTNRREITGADGKPIQTENRDIPSVQDLARLTPDQRAQWRELILIAEGRNNS